MGSWPWQAERERSETLAQVLPPRHQSALRSEDTFECSRACVRLMVQQKQTDVRQVHAEETVENKETKSVLTCFSKIHSHRIMCRLWRLS